MRISLKKMLDNTTKQRHRTNGRPSSNGFSEALTWSQIRGNWKQLFGAFEQMGISFEWHEFVTDGLFDWARSFHPESVEICLNLSGEGLLEVGKERSVVAPQSALFYWTGTDSLKAERASRQKHEFITIEFSRSFLSSRFAREQPGLHPLVLSALKGERSAGVSSVVRLGTQHQEIIASLRRPPVYRWAQYTWYQAKALEVAALFFFKPPPDQELFCHRQQNLAQERIEKVRKILRDSLAEPPALDEIARRVGCSSFYLSRTFSRETGCTISQYLRQVRMEKAAELLRSGKFNVTEAALEVGYSSLSHFSQAFHDTFGCCPGLYPVFPRTPLAGSPHPNGKKELA